MHDKLMIGERLKILLDVNGLEIDRDLLYMDHNFTKANIHKYLNNIRRPTLEDIVRLARIFNTSVDYIVQNTDYILDTWGHDFLDEFGEHAKEKINDYFKNRGNFTLPSSDTRYSLLFSIIFNSIRNDRTMEDFKEDEKEQFVATLDTLVKICINVIDMPSSPNFNLTEVQLLNENIQLYNAGDYRFVDDQIINNLAENTELQQPEKIALLKSYLQQNIATTQKALNLLNELENE